MKKINLTQWIFIALLLGIGFGAWLNISFPPSLAVSKADAWKAISKNISSSESEKKVSIEAIASDTLLTDEQKYDAAVRWANEKHVDLKEQVVIDANRESKMNSTLSKILEVLSIFTEVFLRLIKMIIAPLVFATLVAGVAKLGDLKAVGRIGGKTLLWFFSAS